MGIDEQDMILGRLTRQAKESRRSIAALEAKLAAFSESLTSTAFKLNSTWNPKPRPVASIDDGITAIGALPDCQDIVNTLKELRHQRDREKGISSQLEVLNT